MTDTCISVRYYRHFRPPKQPNFLHLEGVLWAPSCACDTGFRRPLWKGKDGVDRPISWCWSLQVWFRTVLITHDIRIKRYYIWVNYSDLTWTPERDSLVGGISMNFPVFQGFPNYSTYFRIYFLPGKLWSSRGAAPLPTPSLRFDSASKKSRPSFSSAFLI